MRNRRLTNGVDRTDKILNPIGKRRKLKAERKQRYKETHKQIRTETIIAK